MNSCWLWSDKRLSVSLDTPLHLSDLIVYLLFTVIVTLLFFYPTVMVVDRSSQVDIVIRIYTAGFVLVCANILLLILLAEQIEKSRYERTEQNKKGDASL